MPGNHGATIGLCCCSAVEMDVKWTLLSAVNALTQ